MEDVVDQGVPELRRRGLFRTDYTEATLRGHYGLPRPGARRARTPAGPGAVAVERRVTDLARAQT